MPDAASDDLDDALNDALALPPDPTLDAAALGDSAPDDVSDAETDEIDETAPSGPSRLLPPPDAPPTPGDTAVRTLSGPDGTVLRLVPVTSEPLWSLARSIRQRVFVEEQRCPPHEEWDVFDEWEAPGAARHVVLFAGGSPAGTARWRVARTADGSFGADVARLERIALLPPHRGGGLGRILVGALVEAAEAAGLRRIALSAQSHLESFYRSFGFRRSGDDFTEAGILHVPMAREAQPPSQPSA